METTKALQASVLILEGTAACCVWQLLLYVKLYLKHYIYGDSWLAGKYAKQLRTYLLHYGQRVLYLHVSSQVYS